MTCLPAGAAAVDWVSMKDELYHLQYHTVSVSESDNRPVWSGSSFALRVDELYHHLYSITAVSSRDEHAAWYGPEAMKVT